MYAYISISISICIYVYLCISTHIYLYLYLYVYMYIYVSVETGWQPYKSGCAFGHRNRGGEKKAPPTAEPIMGSTARGAFSVCLLKNRCENVQERGLKVGMW